MPYRIPKGTHVLCCRRGERVRKWRSHVTRGELIFAQPKSRLKRELTFQLGEWLLTVPLDEVKVQATFLTGQ